MLERSEGRLEGELIVSAETAASCAGRFGWSTDDELLLYAIHGALHLVGCDDQTGQDRKSMRKRESHYLRRFGIDPRYEENTSETHPPSGTSAGGTNRRDTNRQGATT